MRLIQLKTTRISLLSFFFLFFISSIVFGFEDIINNKQSEGIKYTYKNNLVDSITFLKDKAYSYANANQADLSCDYIERYIKASLDINFLNYSQFEQINNTRPFKLLEGKYLKKRSIWLSLYIFGGSVGFFISIILILSKSIDKTANLLMAAFTFQLSLFIIHSYLTLTNSVYNLPHTLYMSTTVLLLFGPVIYFYFKRITKKYSFKPKDILHLVPIITLLIFLVPIYTLPENEKLRMLLNNEKPYGDIIFISNWISLIVYGVLLIRMYKHSYKNSALLPKIENNWRRNILLFCTLFIILFSINTASVQQSLIIEILNHFQIVLVISFVLYIGIITCLYPNVFGVQHELVYDELENSSKDKLNKYEKSGLTERLSIELKDKLLYLLDHDKIYKQNDITLQKLSELLDTTKHNTSQIINEHFKLNFNKLINSYRIKEAKEILKRNSNDKNFSIIEVAYEVGFNNKVTFNKSFKKLNNTTPSEYIKSLSLVSV